MNVWIDILHMPQFNFYKPFITTLSKQGHRVYITALGRGKLPAIVKKELNGMENVSVSIIGKHRMTRWSAIIEANLIRIVWLFFWACGKKINIAYSNGSHVGMIGRLFHFPAYEFEDDPQAADYNLMCRFATQNHSMLYELPEGYTLNPKDKLLKCLKEWAYLNPRTFVPKVEVLERYGVKPKEYMFLREVSVGTINYTGQKSGAILGIKDLIPKGMKVLLSLEEKKRRNEYPEDWILLQEPIEDIHSLIYYAAGLVSSGDSMAREAALLGVPAYYLGIRYTMPANKAASKVAGLQNRRTMEFSAWVNALVLPIEKNKENTEESSDIENISTVTAPQSACMQASRQTDDPFRSTDIVAQSLSDDSSAKIPKIIASADARTEVLLRRQQALREHIDAEFIDINGYMMNLIEKNNKNNFNNN